MLPSRRPARTSLALLASAALTFSVVVGLSSPVVAFTPSIKPAATTVAAGGTFTLAIAGNRQIYATGKNDDGQLPGAGAALTTLTQIDALPDGTWPTALAAGTGHSVALGENGKVYAVGLNNVGQLANGTTNTASPATWAEVTGLPVGAYPVRQIAAAGLNTYVLGANFEVYGAGWNDSHQISSAATGEINTMTQISVPGDPVQIAAGGPVSGFDGFVLARNTAGFVFGRGDNGVGQLNQAAGADVTTMTLFAGSTGNATMIAAGGAASYIATSTNAILAVGANSKGQLGNGSTSPTSALVTMTPPTGGFVPAAMAAGDSHVVVANSLGTVYAAGEAGAGAVASGSISPDQLVLAPVEEGGGVTIGSAVEVAATSKTTILRNAEGLLLGSGNGFDGQLTGSPGNRLSVVQLSGQWLFNYVRPSLTSPIQVGQVATASPGSWSVKPTAFTYEWFNDGVAISGATSQTYTIAPDDLGDPITVKVRGTRAGFTAFQYESLPVAPAAGTFDISIDPVITGTPAIGNELGVDEGLWTPAATYAYEWRRGGVPIPGADASTYVLTAADLGQDIEVGLVGSATGYTPLSTVSDTVVPVAGAFSSVGVPTFSGALRAGQTLTAQGGAAVPSATTYTYQWLRDGVPISGATAATRRLSSSDAGRSISVVVTATRPGYTSQPATSVAKVVALYNLVRPSISGTAKVGRTLKKKSVGSWTTRPTSYTYRWCRNGTPIGGATGTSYKLKSADKGRRITLVVTARRSGVPSTSATSARTDRVK